MAPKSSPQQGSPPSQEQTGAGEQALPNRQLTDGEDDLQQPEQPEAATGTLMDPLEAQDPAFVDNEDLPGEAQGVDTAKHEDGARAEPQVGQEEEMGALPKNE